MSNGSMSFNQSTVDPEDVKRHSKLAESWWDLNGPMKLLHAYNSVRQALAELGANMTGIDASEELVEVAKEHTYNNPSIISNNPTYYFTTVEQHSEQFRNHYDAVVASEIIEHVMDKELFVKSCVKTLKPGGIIFITTPSKTRFTQIFSIFFAENILGMIPKGTHQYDKLMTPEQLKLLLNQNNCPVEVTRGITFNPLTSRFSLTDSTRMTFAVKAVKNAN
ncbi:hexaprenyldihydroxybenzoate methyltransferase [Danaus plexippus plexippus]|uniref:Hexaprenyldihydroxybenzoate methyltransferase n=1 Tax=Danaus plexippus plexippus TaxID=278856 RepID=A0A212F8B2_DANPL|nr:hexaprenyldihydroxybenzoate methyltransferase [Danaus plexippus plexippus]